MALRSTASFSRAKGMKELGHPVLRVVTGIRPFNTAEFDWPRRRFDRNRHPVAGNRMMP
jgi:hypothetical protein